MKTYSVVTALRVTKSEIEAYNQLPDNMPDIRLSSKQIQFVDELYYKYITRYIDNQSYNLALYAQEQKEKWPSGPRVKKHEAKRFILNQLIELQSPRRICMKPAEAADFFMSALHWRSSNQSVIKTAYQN